MKLGFPQSAGPTEGEARANYISFIIRINDQLIKVNSKLPSGVLPQELWPSDISFFSDVFETPAEAEIFLTNKASNVISAGCRVNTDNSGASTPIWLIVSLIKGPRSATS